MKNYINIEGKEIELTEEQIKLIKESIIEPVKVLPKTWEELGEISGYYMTVGCDAWAYESKSVESNRNIFATKAQAEASIALAQLSQLKAVYNGGWVADWTSKDETKYCICLEDEQIITCSKWFFSQFLYFKDEEARDLFLENFRELIEKAKPLMS